MVNSKSIELYGTPAAFEQALVLLENLPQVRRISSRGTPGKMKLLLCDSLTEGELIALLAHSGVSGFQIR